MRLVIQNLDKIIGKWGGYTINGWSDDGVWYRFDVATLRDYPDGTVQEENPLSIGIRRDIVTDSDGQPVCSIVNPRGTVSYVSVKWLSDMERAINTIIDEYQRRIYYKRV